MDLKALMQKLEIIDKKQNLMEAEKKETTWTDKSGKKHPATQVKGDKYTGKEAEKEDKKKADEGITFNGSIANALLREFGLEEAPVTNPWANDPAKSAAWSALSPQDQAWLGGADPTDPYILARAPNKGKPATPAPAATATPGNTDPTKGSVDYSLGGGKKRTALPQVPPTDGQAAQPAEPAKPAEVPHGINPETGEKYTSIADAPLQEPPGSEKTPDPKKKQMAPVDPGTQELQKWIASKGYNIGAAGADGRLGPNTNKALDAFMADWKAGKISEPDKQQYQKLLGGAKDTAWTKQWFAKANAANGGQAAQPAAGGKGPTVAAAQGQQPGNPLNQKPGGQAAQPAAAPAPAAPTRGGATPIAKQQPKAAQPAAASGQQSPQQMLAQQDIARAREKAGKVAPTGTGSGTLQGGQAAQPADKVDLSVNNPAMDPTNNASKEVQDKLDAMRSQYKAVTPVRENVQSEDDLILARIRGFSVR